VTMDYMAARKLAVKAYNNLKKEMEKDGISYELDKTSFIMGFMKGMVELVG